VKRLPSAGTTSTSTALRHADARPAPGRLRRRGAAVAPNNRGGWRDPSDVSRELRQARGSGPFSWVTSHVFRKTCATLLDENELSARQIADQLGHAKVSMTQDTYLGRRLTNRRTEQALDRTIDEALQ